MKTLSTNLAAERAEWLVWLTMMLAALNLRTVVTSVSPLLPVIRHALGISNVGAGWLMSIPVLSMGLFAQFALPALRRFGLERAVAALLGVMGLAILTRALWPNFAVLIGSALLSGACIAMLGPLLSGYVKKHLAHRLTVGISVFSFSMGTGAALAAAVSGALYTEGLAGWPAILGLWGIPCLLAALAWWGGRGAPLQHGPEQAAHAALPWRNRVAWLLVLFFALQAGLFYALLAWFTPFLGERAGDYRHGVAQFGVFTVAQLGGSLLLPALLERLRIRRGEYVAVGLWVAGLTALLLPGAPWPGLLLLSFGCGATFSYSLLLPLRLTDNYAAGSAWSVLMLGAGYVLASLFPLGYGVLAEATGHYRSIFQLMLVQALVMLALLAWLNRLAGTAAGRAAS